MLNPWKEILSKINEFELVPGLHSFVNPYSMLLLEDKLETASEIDFWHIDGISLVNKINGSLDTNYVRNSFDNTSIAPKVFQFVRTKKLKLAVVGTKKDYIKKAVVNIENQFSIHVDYYRDGYFNSDAEKEECYMKIIKSGIVVVIVGMGTPYQEDFLIGLKRRGWNGYGFTCGGYLHQIAKSENYYPVFFDRYNIRWVYRIIDEPKLFRRYAIDYPMFFLKFKKFLKKG